MRTERSQGWWEHRIRVVERVAPDLWRVQFGHRPTGEFCTLAGCISHPDDDYSCGVELRLPEPIPVDAQQDDPDTVNQILIEWLNGDEAATAEQLS